MSCGRFFGTVYINLSDEDLGPFCGEHLAKQAPNPCAPPVIKTFLPSTRPISASSSTDRPPPQLHIGGNEATADCSQRAGTITLAPNMDACDGSSFSVADVPTGLVETVSSILLRFRCEFVGSLRPCFFASDDGFGDLIDRH